MSANNTNQKNKAAVWDYWQKMNYIEPDNLAKVIRGAFHEDVDWNGPHPINQLKGVDALITGFWEPLLHSFPDIKRHPYIFMGGLKGDEEWVSGVGYLTGTFVKDWLGIPATSEKTNIHFGQFYVMRDGKISEGYVVYDLLAVMRQAGFQVLPPARGGEGGKIPPPFSNDGVLLTEQDELETKKSLELVDLAMNGMGRYVRSRDGGNMKTMEHEHYWSPNMHWYGLSGIGACLSLEEFEDFHQRPWLQGFGDRHLWESGGGRSMATVAEGNYIAGGCWDTFFSHHHGEYLGVPGSGKLISIRDFDWWKRKGDYLIENWCPIDIIDIFMQMGVDLFGRLRRQVEQRKLGKHWFDPS